MKKLNEDYNPYKVMNIPLESWMEDEEDRFTNIEDFIKQSDEDEFEIGQCYDTVPDKKIICKFCQSDKWIVGVGSCHTSIKCVNCKFELCIHDG